MSNNIVFQHSAGELKTSIYGINGSVYKPVQVNSSGQLSIVGTVKAAGGTVQLAGGTATVKVAGGTVKLAGGTATVKVAGGTVKLAGGTATVKVAGGTVKLAGGTVLIQGLNGGTTQSVKVDTSGQLMVGLYDRKFTEVSETITNIPIAGEFGTVIDTSKYQDYSWYINRLSTSQGNTVNVQLAVAPTHGGVYALIGGTATVIGSTPQVVTNDYYFHYTKLKVWTPSRTATVQVWFNGRY